MKIEHVAFQVSDPAGIAAWYVSHLGLRIKRAQSSSPYGHFLADDGDTVLLEFYNNPVLSVPDYGATDPLMLHVAFAVPDVPATRQRLLEAGATAHGEVSVTDVGDELAMLRDPWGLAVQLVCRRNRMLAD